MGGVKTKINLGASNFLSAIPKVLATIGVAKTLRRKAGTDQKLSRRQAFTKHLVHSQVVKASQFDCDTAGSSPAGSSRGKNFSSVCPVPLLPKG
jgi:hypothetical protein